MGFCPSATSPSPTFRRGYKRGMARLLRGVFDRAKQHSFGRPLGRLDDENSLDGNSEEEESNTVDSANIVRSRNAKKGPFDFDQLKQVQQLGGEHSGAVWCLKFSLCGRLLATAGQDNIIRVWVLKDHHDYFTVMRERYNLETTFPRAYVAISSARIAGSLHRTLVELHKSPLGNWPTDHDESLSSSSGRSVDEGALITGPFSPKPFCVYRGHTADVLDLCWSKNYFVLSSGMDRTVRLWHVSRPECLCCFQHTDFVTCIAFLPKVTREMIHLEYADDRYFLSGSLDGKLRLWHIPEKKVALWNEVEQAAKLITAMSFVKNGKFAVVGTFNGRCIFYSTDQLKYHTVIDVRSRGQKDRGHKITGLAVHGDKLLVTANDSRVRLYDLRDMALTCKFKGASNESSQIRAAFSPDGRHVVCGSEDRFVYLWRTNPGGDNDGRLVSLAVRKDRNSQWERVRGHNHMVTAGIFAPRPELFLAQLLRTDHSTSPSVPDRRRTLAGGDVLVSADLGGSIRVFMNRTRIKAGSSVFFQTS